MTLMKRCTAAALSLSHLLRTTQTPAIGKLRLSKLPTIVPFSLCIFAVHGSHVHAPAMSPLMNAGSIALGCMLRIVTSDSEIFSTSKDFSIA
jgi:hypothetical protein